MNKSIIFFLLISQICFSQLGKTRTELFENEPKNYDTKDVQNDFTVYGFMGNTPKLNGETCNELVSYYIDNETQICFKVSYASCSAAANTYAKFFNEVAVQTKMNEWKDYSNNSIYTLKVEGRFAYVEHYFDYENVSVSQNRKFDKFDFLKKAKVFFEEYIIARLQEVDEEGYAYEYDEAREFYTGDINLDGIPDVVVLYTIEGVGRGNNWYRHILLLPNINNEISDINHTMVYGTLSGQGKFIGIQNGYAVFEMLNYSSDNIKDVLKEKNPSKYQRLGYGIRGNQMVIDEIKE